MTSPQATTTSKPEDEPQSETVYITKSGKRYHKADCRHIAGRDVIEKTIAEAEEDGYTSARTASTNGGINDQSELKCTS